MATKVLPHTKQRPWLTLLKHRRNWAYSNEELPSIARILEDGVTPRLTEDGVARMTEGS